MDINNKLKYSCGIYPDIPTWIWQIKFVTRRKPQYIMLPKLKFLCIIRATNRKQTVHLCRGTNNQHHTAESFPIKQPRHIWWRYSPPFMQSKSSWMCSLTACNWTLSSARLIRAHTISYFFKIHSNVICPYMPWSRSHK